MYGLLIWGKNIEGVYEQSKVLRRMFGLKRQEVTGE
jgi:hypothetical protein